MSTGALVVAPVVLDSCLASAAPGPASIAFYPKAFEMVMEPLAIDAEVFRLRYIVPAVEHWVQQRDELCMAAIGCGFVFERGAMIK